MEKINKDFETLMYKKESISLIIKLLNDIEIKGVSNCKILLDIYAALNNQAMPMRLNNCTCNCCSKNDKNKEGNETKEHKCNCINYQQVI
jgi:hypothetical protein